jgi:hypothetical protein
LAFIGWFAGCQPCKAGAGDRVLFAGTRNMHWYC